LLTLTHNLPDYPVAVAQLENRHGDMSKFPALDRNFENNILSHPSTYVRACSSAFAALKFGEFGADQIFVDLPKLPIARVNVIDMGTQLSALR
jgi:hypothetical protein